MEENESLEITHCSRAMGLFLHFPFGSGLRLEINQLYCVKIGYFCPFHHDNDDLSIEPIISIYNIFT